MKKIFTPVFFLPVFCFSQNVLKPSIGLTSLPDDASAICTIPVYTGSFDSPIRQHEEPGTME